MARDRSCQSLVLHQWLKFGSCLQGAVLCCLTDSNLNRYSLIKNKYISASKQCWLYTKRVCEVEAGGCVFESFRQLAFMFWPSPGKWSAPVCMKILFLLSICCLLSSAVSSASIQCSPNCMCSSVTAYDRNIFISINCSNLGLPHYILYISSTKQHNASLTNSTPVHEIPKINILDLSYNNLSSAKVGINDNLLSENFTGFIHVITLDLSHNSISDIQTGDLSMYTGVASADLSHNQIRWMDMDVFTEMDELSCLILSHNAIDEIANDTFQPLHNLRILDLSYNNLRIFSMSGLRGLSSLQYLYLNHNHLLSVTDSIHRVPLHLPSLIVLDLSWNQLKELPLGTHISSPKLQKLDISRNSLREITSYFLKGFHSLQNVNLDQNPVSAITGPVFQNTSIAKLSISSMPNLQNISHDAFLGLSGLLSLNLSHNRGLHFLQPNLLTPLLDLRVLDVSNSGLILLSQITFHKNKALGKIHLSNNPFSCSCTNAWLADQVSDNQTKFVHSSSLFCLDKNGVRRDITNASFECPHIFIHNISTSISSKLGSQVLFRCQHQADEPGVVRWTTPSGEIFYQHHFHQDANKHLRTLTEVQPASEFHSAHYWHASSSYHSELSSYKERVSILSDGSLYIDYMLRSDAGSYQCHVSNAHHNHTLTLTLYVECAISGDIKIISCLVGLISALSFFILTVTYVIISWIARRLVNKRRREIIRQMLENINAYKSGQIARIHENYTHQLGRVRNQYHIQCARLHRNYTSQVAKMKRGCSNQVERVRENYNSKLAQLREYSSCQIIQIREMATNQIVRIRDYGCNQLEKLRETYKLQQQHVLKLLDTMNLENCRNVVETECMRAESMMFDIDLLAPDDRTDSPISNGESEYSTAACSPSSSPDDHSDGGLHRDLSHNRREFSTDSSDNSGIITQVQTTIELESGLPAGSADDWKYYEDIRDDEDVHRHYLKSRQSQGCYALLQHQNDSTLLNNKIPIVKPETPLPTLELNHERFKSDNPLATSPVLGHNRSDSDSNTEGLYMTPQASPTKMWSGVNSTATFKQLGRDDWFMRRYETCDIDFMEDVDNKETIV